MLVYEGLPIPGGSFFCGVGNVRHIAIFEKFSKNFVILITKTEIRGYYIYEEKIIRAETFSPMESFFEIMYNRIMYMGF